MKASILDLRKHMGDVLNALDHNETVTIFHRGKPKGTIVPAGVEHSRSVSIKSHPAFGIWKDRGDISSVDRFVRDLRKGRVDAD